MNAPLPSSNTGKKLDSFSKSRSGKQSAEPGTRPGRLSVYLPMDDTTPFHLLPNSTDSPNFGNAPKSPSLIHPIYADPASFPPGYEVPAQSPSSDIQQQPLWPLPKHDSVSQELSEKPPASNNYIPEQLPHRQRNTSPTLTNHSLSSSSNLPLTPTNPRAVPPLMLAFQNLPVGMQQNLDSPSAWLLYYFILNLGLTLYNKLVLVKFPYPWALTGVHSLCGAIGSYILLQQGFFVQARLARREVMILILFSMLYTINIAVSNLSLNLVTVPFHQVVRATTPIFTILINVGFMNKKTPLKVYISLIPVVMGVGFATYGEYAFTLWGFCLTVLGALLAAIKGIATNVLLVGRLKLHPLDLLLRMSPLAFAQCIIYSYSTGELVQVREYGAVHMDRSKAMGLLFNGVFAFALNVVSFSANKKTSALTMTVAANVKQVLTILFAVWLFNVVLTATNTTGIVLTLFGGGYYAYVDHRLKKERSERATNVLPSSSPPMPMLSSEKR